MEISINTNDIYSIESHLSEHNEILLRIFSKHLRENIENKLMYNTLKHKASTRDFIKLKNMITTINGKKLSREVQRAFNESFTLLNRKVYLIDRKTNKKRYFDIYDINTYKYILREFLLQNNQDQDTIKRFAKKISSQLMWDGADINEMKRVIKCINC